MRRSSVLFVGLLVGMASCGSSPDVPADTHAVATEPRGSEETVPSDDDAVQASAPLPAVPVPRGLAAPPGAKVGFVGGTRFVVFAQEGEPSFSVLDRDHGETFRVLGEPIGESVGAQGRFMEMGLANGAPHWNLTSDREGRLLVRSIGGVQLVNLFDRGHMVAAWRGSPTETSIAPDGKTFSVATTEALHIVRASDGAFATFESGSDRVPTWGDTNVHWVSKGTLTRVNRETLAASVVRAPTETAQFGASAEATVVAFASEGTVSVHVAGTAAPILRIASPNETEQLTIDRDGKNVVWIERFIDREQFTDKGHLHVGNVAARTHVRFAMTNSGCANAPETIEAVRDGKIITDPSCSIGCPSVRWTHRAVTYDGSTGKIVHDTRTTEELSWNEEQGALRSEVEAAATRLGVETSAMLNQPTSAGAERSFLVARQKDLALVELTPGTAPFALDDSNAAALSALAFSSDGAVLAGIVAGRMRAWDAATGRVILR